MASIRGWDGKLAAVLWQRDPTAIAGMVEREFGHPVSSFIVEKWLPQMRRPPGGWSDGSVRTWLKLRLDEWYPHTPGMQSDEARLTVELHVFPIWWQTTPEQDERVRRDETPVPDSTARSKVSKSKRKQITPVDSVANKVVKHG